MEERGKMRGGVAKVDGRLYKCSGGRQILPGIAAAAISFFFFQGHVILVSGCDLAEEQGHIYEHAGNFDGTWQGKLWTGRKIFVGNCRRSSWIGGSSHIPDLSFQIDISIKNTNDIRKNWVHLLHKMADKNIFWEYSKGDFMMRVAILTFIFYTWLRWHAQCLNVLYSTATKIPFIFSQKRNCAASVPISRFMCGCERFIYSQNWSTYFPAADYRQTGPGSKSLTGTWMYVETGTEAAPFIFWEYFFQFFSIVSLQCTFFTSY